jgi:hypothetical protein
MIPLVAHLRQHYGFEPDLGRLSVPGLCCECQAAQAGATSASI